MAIPAAATTAIPAVNEPVRELRYPKTKGPAKPAMDATALMSPTAAGAVELLSSVVGMAQNTGRKAVDTAMSVKRKTAIGRE